ncbi:MAG: gfo/Idh/MocA family oxidoreductase [Gemmataceae bacterium]
MIRLGMLDFDTSHAVEFTRRLNRKGIAKDQHVEGAEVVIACPGESKMAPERIPGYKAEMESLGVPLVERPTDMIGKVDGLLIESLEGGVHYGRAKPFLDAGLPCFIDKPFTCSAADAKKIVALSARKKAPVFSSSSLRFAPEVVAFQGDARKGGVLGVVSYGPAPYHEGKPGDVPRNPGLFNYGIHPLEVLYAVMGPGCTRVSCHHEKGVDVVVGQWKDGRLATLRGLRDGASPYGFLAFTGKGVEHVTIDTRFIYRELCKQIVKFFQTKAPPVDPATTVEMMAFLEAALKSAGNHGAGEKLAS